MLWKFFLLLNYKSLLFQNPNLFRKILGINFWSRLITLLIQVISFIQIIDPYVMMEVYNGAEAKQVFQTKVVNNNGNSFVSIFLFYFRFLYLFQNPYLYGNINMS